MRVIGLVVWFSLRVREVSGSIPESPHSLFYEKESNDMFNREMYSGVYMCIHTYISTYIYILYVYIHIYIHILIYIHIYISIHACSVSSLYINTKKTKKKKGYNTTLFPGGPPPQYWAGSTHVNFGVRMGSGALYVIWSYPFTTFKCKTKYISRKLSCSMYICKRLIWTLLYVDVDSKADSKPSNSFLNW